MQGLHLRGPACQMQGCSGQQQQAIPKPARVSVQCKVARNQARSSPTASAAETQAPTTEIAPQKKDKVSFVSLGCPKNVVDGENVVDGFIAQTILHIKHTHTHARTHTHKHTHTHTKHTIFQTCRSAFGRRRATLAPASTGRGFWSRASTSRGR
jgi:hypothetical protein